MAKPYISGLRRGNCEGKIFQRLNVEGEVTINPTVKCGPVSVTCLEGRIIPGGSSCSKPGKQPGKSKCKVHFVQELLVEVPVEIQVEADCNLVGIRCGVPTVGPSPCLPEQGGLSDCSDSSSGGSGTSCSKEDDSSGSWEDNSSGTPDSQDWSGESGSPCE